MNQEMINLPTDLSHRYKIIRQLGEGSNGTTWLAKNPAGESFAIKALRLAVSEDLKSLDLFKREAEVLSSLHVHGVPTFYESAFSKQKGGECFIVQQFIDAPSLYDIMKTNHHFHELDTIEIMAHVTRILQSLHMDYAPPVIHRDIKPSNILCRADSISKTLDVWLIDFGAVANPQTRNGGSTIAGTYGYMSPEQMLGECTISSDYYALGATAFHMLTGVAPYNLESDGFKIDIEKELDKYAPNTSAPMRKLLSILMSPKPENRPKNAVMLLNMIHAVQAGRDPEIQTAVKKSAVPSWFSRLIRRNSEKTMTPDATWIQADGIIRCISNYCLIYTFNTKDNEHFEGACNSPQFLNTPTLKCVRETPAPICCTVRYNPKDPMINELVHIKTAVPLPNDTEANNDDVACGYTGNNILYS